MEFFSDSPVEAEWFRKLDSRLLTARSGAIRSRGSNPPIVESLVSYDRPDIILLDGEQPILVIEITREVPTGHNVGQRVARLVRSAEMGVTTMFFLPFEARKHGDYSSICRINARLLSAMRRMSEIHGVPVVPIDWPANKHGALITDGSENIVISDLVSASLDSWPGSSSSAMDRHHLWLRDEESRRINDYPSYGKFPPSVRIVRTDSFLDGLRFSLGEVSLLERRLESLVYEIGMTPENCRRQDPYTGMQFVYDYGWLREGPTPADRSKNLILHVPNVDGRTWRHANPNDPETKSCNWYLIADAIVLSDEVLLLQH
jgi:hypothetical protein